MDSVVLKCIYCAFFDQYFRLQPCKKSAVKILTLQPHTSCAHLLITFACVSFNLMLLGAPPCGALLE